MPCGLNTVTSGDNIGYIYGERTLLSVVFTYHIMFMYFRQFELPWSEADASQTAVDSRKVKKRKRKN